MTGGFQQELSQIRRFAPVHYSVVGDRITVREAFSLLGNEDACAVDWNDNIVMDRSEAARIYRASCEQRSGIMGCGRS